MIGIRDVTLKIDRPKELLLEKHTKYLKQYANDDSGTEQIMAEYLKMSGMFWGLNALYLMKSLNDQSAEVTRALEFIKKCQTDDGGFSAALNHDSHLLHTLSAVQMLVILDKCNSDYIDTEKCTAYVKSLQQEDGSFFGDKWGEVDTRFSFCALATLKLLNRLDAINIENAVEFVMSCNNQIDGGFGSKPGSESHSAYVYCCVGSLAIANKLNRIDADHLGWWLSERQLPSGGLNGRPEKLPDLCYSWWCLSSMKMINRMHLIDHKKLLKFILACQDEELGGFSDRPENLVDPYHTLFGIASISLISYHCCESASGDNEQSKPEGVVATNDEGSQKKQARNGEDEFKSITNEFRNTLRPVNPVLCMPEDRLTDFGLCT